MMQLRQTETEHTHTHISYGPAVLVSAIVTRHAFTPRTPVALPKAQIQASSAIQTISIFVVDAGFDTRNNNKRIPTAQPPPHV